MRPFATVFHSRLRMPAAGRRASVLVVVLVTLVLATIALTLFIERATDDLLVETREADARRLRLEAYSALETTLAVLQDFKLVNGGLHSPAEGWSDPLEWAGYTPQGRRRVTVSFEDESGKLSLPKTTHDTFVTLFEAWGLVKSDAERLADALQQWAKPDYVPTSGLDPDYEREKLPYLAPGRTMRSFSELRAIAVARELLFDEAGRPNKLYQRFATTVSLLSYSSSNLNAAPGGTLTAYGMDEAKQALVSDYLLGRGSYRSRGAGFFRNDGEVSQVLGISAPTGLGLEIQALRIRVTVSEGGGEFQLSVVISPNGGATAVTDKAKTRREDGTTPTVSSGVEVAKPTEASALNYPFTLLEIRENEEPLRLPETEEKDPS